MAKRIHRQEGFTLIELMIVILIIGILVGIAVPVFLAAQNNAKKKACLSNQRNFLSAADIFAADADGYPTSADATVDGRAWPEDYYDGEMVDNAVPACPSGGTVAVTYGDSETRPSTSCDYAGHGSP